MNLLRVTLVFAALGLGACGDASLQQYEPGPEEPAPTDFTLRTGVMPVIAEHNCISCHNAVQYASLLDLDVDADTMHANLMTGGARESSGYGEDVDLADPSKSLLVLAPLTGSDFAHSSQKFFHDSDDAGYLTVLGWIESGAPND